MRLRNKQLPANRIGWDLVQLLVTVGLAESKGEARRLIQQGGVSVDGERQSNANSQITGGIGATKLVESW